MGSLRRCALWAVIVFVSALVLISLVPKPPLKRGIPLSHVIYDRNGRLLRINAARDGKLRVWIPLEKQSPVLIKATLLKEDRYYWFHPGVNPWALLRGFISTYITRSHRLGGSTITMQLARIRYKMNTRSITGKLVQLIKSLQLELFYSKKEILETYLNLAPYGGNIEGAGAASRLYFSKQPHEITTAEAIALAVLPQKPGRSLGKGWNEAFNTLLQYWNNTYPNDTEVLRAIFPVMRFEKSAFLAPHFCDSLIADYPEDSVLTSTLDSPLQELLENQLHRYILRKKDIGIQNASAMIVDHRSMAIRAVVGSANYFDQRIEGQVNGTRAKRSPGSTLKPFVYALAIEQGLIHSETMLKDAPASFGSFNPENFDGEFIGPVSAREALQRSRNIPSVFLASQLKDPDLYSFLQKAKVDLSFERRHYGMALVLGGAEVTMEDLIRLYSIFPNKGELRDLQRLTGEEESMEPVPLLSKESCFIVSKMLAGTPRQDQHYQDEWTRSPMSIPWKTGTSYGFRDAWTVGIVGPYVVGIWVGHFNGEGNPAFIGGKAAAPLFFDIADALKLRRETHDYMAWSTIPNAKEISVCAVSGQLSTPFCSAEKKTWFIPGRSPIELCNIHREVKLNKKTGFRACPDFTGPTASEVFEFWPSDLLKMFRSVGVPRRVPPPFDSSCADTIQSPQGLPPKIMSPRPGVIYNYRLGTNTSPRIPLTSVSDADVQNVYWYVNQTFLNKAKMNETLFWAPKPGQYILRAVDDHGRSDVVKITVNAIN